jgi:hypothetical protein
MSHLHSGLCASRFIALTLVFTQWWWLGQTSYVITCVVAKISIAVALLRLTVTKMHKILLWTVIGVTIVVGLVFWFVLTLQCKPVDFFWNRMNPGAKGTCLSTDTIIGIAYLYSVTATLCDFVLGLLPISLVWKLQMTPKTKIALAAILSMGCMYVLSQFAPRLPRG